MKDQKLMDIAMVGMGRSFRGGLENEPLGDVAVIRMQDIDEANLLHVDRLPRVAVADVKDGQLVREGDVVFRSRGLTNTAALVSADLGPAVLAAPMLLIRTRTTQVDPAYLLWFINHPATQRALATHAKGTQVQMISKAALQNLPIPVPSLETQQRIVGISQLAERERIILTSILAKRQVIADSLLMHIAVTAPPRRAQGASL